ncbi:MAG: 1-deoxy-D-xylulose-5-phosphate reductoisomerase [Acidobacteria bacterium]|nr:1-deoxy-D-xylulose-5-phosphate reductoisomerase [Acidobacteriota bacterium]
MKKLSILGSTGSIGKNALSIVDLYPDRFQVVALAAQSRTELLLEQSLRYAPDIIAMFDSAACANLQTQLPGKRILCGLEGVVEAACHPDADMVIAAISGAAGLIPTFRAAQAGKAIALANKETLVMAGDLIMPMVHSQQVRMLPVDSEHSALHQCLRGSRQEEVRRLILTASGGPFFRASQEQLERVTVQEALQHPTWKMGPKITIDSATLMNKGFEVIEAHHLFGIRPEQVSVLIHPQSTVHSLVEFVDGTVLAQMSITDMRNAILYALAYPERWDSPLPSLDLLAMEALEFFAPDAEKFPCLRLAYESLRLGQTYPAALNAANEVAVQLFLEDRLRFSAIPEIIEQILESHRPQPVADLEVVLDVDRRSRDKAFRAAEVLTSR